MSLPGCGRTSGGIKEGAARIIEALPFLGSVGLTFRIPARSSYTLRMRVESPTNQTRIGLDVLLLNVYKCVVTHPLAIWISKHQL